MQPHALSITNATEYGLVYTPDEVAALSAAAHDCTGWGCTWTVRASPTRSPRSDCHPGEVTWRAGVEALSFGFVKNGGHVG